MLASKEGVNVAISLEDENNLTLVNIHDSGRQVKRNQNTMGCDSLSQDDDTIVSFIAQKWKRTFLFGPKQLVCKSLCCSYFLLPHCLLSLLFCLTPSCLPSILLSYCAKEPWYLSCLSCIPAMNLSTTVSCFSCISAIPNMTTQSP